MQHQIIGDLYCEPTYEELKLQVRGMKKSTEWYCEPTYEELKFGIVGITGIVGIDCEPTYEELKFNCNNCKLFFLEKIASLPMRNWNEVGGRWGEGKFGDCEPTYEELKFDNKNQNEILTVYCEPTYEELKW